MQAWFAQEIVRRCLAGAVLSMLVPEPARGVECPPQVEGLRRGEALSSRTLSPCMPSRKPTASRKAPGPTGSIAGTVRAADTGAPLAAGWIRVLDAAGEFVADASVDASGAFVSALPAGTYSVMTMSSLGSIDELYDDIACPGQACSLARGTPVVVTAGATADVSFALAPRRRVSDNDPCPTGSCNAANAAPVAAAGIAATSGINPASSDGAAVDRSFFTVAPCRVFDTRGEALPLGAVPRTVEVGGQCGVPATARAAVLDITATRATQEGSVLVYPARASVSTINFVEAKRRANNAIVGLGPAGDVSVVVGQADDSNPMVDVIIDVTGYFQ